MDIFTVVCPDCKKEFYGDMLLYSLKVELHCPYCGKYFCKEDSPKIFTGGTGASAVAQVPGGVSLDMIYRPHKEDQ